MKIEVLVAAMYKDGSLYDAMNLHTDAVIINQCDTCGSDTFERGGSVCRLLSFTERGIGNSRNRALSAAEGDIIIFADEDIRYVDNYAAIVSDAFERTPDADAFIFNINAHGGERREDDVKRDGKMSFRSALSFGAVRLAVKREKIGDTKFSMYFGGGARYGSGEDTIFIQDLFRRGLHVYGSTSVIADVSQDESSWFSGFNDKYFFDKGALYGALWGNFAKPLSFLPAANWCRKLRRADYFHIVGQYFKGIDDWREECRTKN